MMRTAIVTAVIAAAGLGIAVGYGVGRVDAGASYPNTFTVTQTPGRLIDERTGTAPDFSRPVPPGDTIVFKQELMSDRSGPLVGVSRGTCTAVFDTKLLCNATFDLSGAGSIEVQAEFDLASPVGDYAISGGTGAFANKHGWGHFVAHEDGTESHTFHLAG